MDAGVEGHFAAAGTADDVREKLGTLLEAGIEHVALLPWLTPGQTPEQFARALMEAAGDLFPGGDVAAR